MWRLVMAGGLTLQDVHGGLLDWETVDKLNALMDMEDDYQSAFREKMMEPKE